MIFGFRGRVFGDFTLIFDIATRNIANRDREASFVFVPRPNGSQTQSETGNELLTVGNANRSVHCFSIFVFF